MTKYIGIENKILDLYCNHNKLGREIAEILNIHESTVFNYIRKNNVTKRSKKIKFTVEELTDLIIKYRTKSLSELSKEYGYTIPVIKKLLVEVGVEIRSVKEATYKAIGCKTRAELSNNQLDIFNGLMLSDGCLSVSGSSVNANYIQTTIDKEFAENVAHVFHNLSSKIYLNDKSNKREKLINGKLVNQKDLYHVSTKRNLTLTDLYYKWYKNNIRIVPKDIIINPLTLLYWFYGDGTSWQSKKHNYSSSISLCTNNFQKEEVDFLNEKLHSLNIKGNVYKSSNVTSKDNIGYVITIYDKYARLNFYNYIEDYHNVSAFDYKFKYPLNI